MRSLLLATLLASPCLAQDVHDLVSRLGAPGWEDREEAQRRLEALDASAGPVLESYLDSDDPEVAGRVWRIRDDLAQADSPDRRAAWIARGPGFLDLAVRWARARETILGGGPDEPAALLEEVALEELRQALEEDRRPLSNEALVARLARAFDRRVEEGRRRRGRLEKVCRLERLRPALDWIDLLDEACRTGALRGQAVEDLVLFLLDPELAPDPEDFGGEHDRRTAFALLVGLESDRNFGPGPPRCWAGAFARIASQELFSRTAERARRRPAGGSAAEREVSKELAERIAIEGCDSLAFDLAIYPSLVALADEVAIGGLHGPLDHVRSDAGWAQEAWLDRAGRIAGRARTREEIERELVRRLGG